MGVDEEVSGGILGKRRYGDSSKQGDKGKGQMGT